MAQAHLTHEALAILTPEQNEALRNIMQNNQVTLVGVSSAAGLGLPDGYLSVRIDYKSGSPIYGGIDPEGKLST